MAQQTINIGTSPNDGTGDPLRNSFNKANLNFTELYGGAGVVDDSVTYAKLGAEFKAGDNPVSDMDFSLYQVFSKGLAANTTLTISNAEIGMVKDLVVTGNFTLSLPAGTIASGEYDGTATNLIQILVVNTGDYWYTISQGTATAGPV
jgi:hypothetical protein